MGSRQLLTLYFTLTKIFSDGKAKIYLQINLKFAVIVSGISVVSSGITIGFQG